MGSAADWATDYKHPGRVTVRLTLFWVTNYTLDSSQRVLDKAEALLAEHGLGLDIYPSRTRTKEHTIQDPGRLLKAEDYGPLRSQAAAIFDDQKLPGRRQRLPVFFCEIEYPDASRMIDKFSTNPPSTWPPYILIGNAVASDNVTLLHEIGHAAGINKHNTDGDPEGVPIDPTKPRNIMNVMPTRSIMFRAQVLSIARAYFAR
jgi:hypothetical protein